jgi:hypothetical protein
MEYVTVNSDELEFDILSRHHRSRRPILARLLDIMKTLSAIGRTSLRRSRSAGRVARVLAFTSLAACAALFSGGARAQLLEQIDVSKEGRDAIVVVRFAAPVQYLRHTPLTSGRTLRVYLQVTGRGVQPGDMVPVTLRSQGGARVPRFSATFPETGGALMLEFDREVRFSVGPGPDGRSVVLTLPEAGN